MITDRTTRIRRNAQLRQMSNWFLAISLGLTGSGVFELFVETPRLSTLEAVTAIAAGFFAITVAIAILGELECEDDKL